MKYKYVLALWLAVASALNGQTGDQNRLEDILEVYQNSLSRFMNIQGCGHTFDGPAYFIKQLENTSLDALLHLDEDEEMEMGKKVIESLRDSASFVDNHELKADAEGILKRLVPHVSRKKISYQIYILESEEINAFAIVGGHVFLTTALLDFVDTIDELAFVIGHEVAHIDQFHTLRKQKKLLMASSFAQFMDMQHLTQIALDINLMISAPFDQIDEYEADRHGVDLARKAGYNTANFTDFFTKLSAHQTKNVISKIMRTHPFADDRAACVTEYLEDN